jgi:basic membrane protein A
MRRPARLVPLALGVALALATGCGGEDDAATTDTATVEEEPAVEPVRIGLVTDVRGRGGGLATLAVKGLEDAVAQLGVEGRVLEPESRSEYLASLRALADEEFELVVAVGPALARASHRTAEEFPATSFAVVDVAYGGIGCERKDRCNLPNLVGLVFAEQEAGYLAGTLAGLVTKSGTVSSVAGGEPSSQRYVAGYERGARAANAEVTILRGTAPQLPEEAACAAVVLEQVERGSDVVLAAAPACGVAVLEAAAAAEALAIGTEVDRSDLGRQVLASAVKNVDVAVFKTIDAVQGGNFEGGRTHVFGVEEDGVGLLAPAADQDALQALERQRRRLAAGEIAIPRTG